MPRFRKRFIDFVNKKYKDKLPTTYKQEKFYYYDDYACWMFFNICKEDYEEYYVRVEEDWRDYSNTQTGLEKD